MNGTCHPSPVDPLVIIERRVRALYELAADSDDDEHIARIGREIDALEMEICQAVPRTFAGLGVKVRFLWESAKESAGPDDELNLRTLLEALEVMGDDSYDAADDRQRRDGKGRIALPS